MTTRLRAAAAAIAAGLLAATIGGAALARRRRAAGARRDAELDHAVRGRLTVVQGETELVLGLEGVSPDERERSSQTVLAMLNEIEALLRGWRSAGARE